MPNPSKLESVNHEQVIVGDERRHRVTIVIDMSEAEWIKAKTEVEPRFTLSDEEFLARLPGELQADLDSQVSPV